MKKTLILCLTCFALCYGHYSIAENLSQRADVQQFIKEMSSQYQFESKSLQQWFAKAKIRSSITRAMKRPAERKPWHQYRPIFITKKRIQGGKQFLKKYKKILAKAEKKYGVPAEIITAIIGVETFYGKLQGNYPVLDALSTLAFDYPPRAKFFRKELVQFLLMCREEKKDPKQFKGSYAGAMGMGQFIPSSFRDYAIDFDGDGKKDIWQNPADAIGSVANYFKLHGWKSGEAVADIANAKVPLKIPDPLSLEPIYSLKQMQKYGFTLPKSKKTPLPELMSLVVLEQKKQKDYWLTYPNFYVITRYNHSKLYSMAVFQLSEAIRH
jgi:membrane-bound lytic murein transglycosylase B